MLPLHLFLTIIFLFLAPQVFAKVDQPVPAELFCQKVVDKLNPRTESLTIDSLRGLFSESPPPWYTVGGDRGYLTSDLLGGAMGFFDAHLISSTNDLRYVPRMMNGMKLLVVVDGLGELTPKRLAKVEGVSKKKGIQIGVIYYGAIHELGKEQAYQLHLLASSTGGPFVNVGPKGRLCYEGPAVASR